MGSSKMMCQHLVRFHEVSKHECGAHGGDGAPGVPLLPVPGSSSAGAVPGTPVAAKIPGPASKAAGSTGSSPAKVRKIEESNQGTQPSALESIPAGQPDVDDEMATMLDDPAQLFTPEQEQLQSRG